MDIGRRGLGPQARGVGRLLTEAGGEEMERCGEEEGVGE